MIQDLIAPERGTAWMAWRNSKSEDLVENEDEAKVRSGKGAAPRAAPDNMRPRLNSQEACSGSRGGEREKTASPRGEFDSARK